jgi:hypothetical protein
MLPLEATLSAWLNAKVCSAAAEEIPYQPTRDTGIKVFKISSRSS